MLKGTSLKLPPVSHKTLRDHVRVFMFRTEHYWVWVDTNYTRVYDDNTLPDEIKTKLAMVLATPRHNKMHTQVEVEMNTLLPYMNNHNPELDEVGWQSTENLFCIVLPTQFLNSLKGEPLTKEETWTT
jgi:hypothetical protein